MGRSRKKRLPQEAFETVIESLSQDGRGVTHIEGKAMFIDGALPGERVMFRYTSKHRRHDEGKVEEILEPSVDRVIPKCTRADVCGGCSLQHLAADKQIEYKQQSMLEGLKHLGKVEPEHILAPLTADVWGYRRKARLGVRHVRKKGKVLVGFREKRNSFITELERCPVLHPSVGENIETLSTLIGSLDAIESIPQIEVAVSDNATVLIFRHLEPLSAQDLSKLTEFAVAENIGVYLQSAGPDSVTPLANAPEEFYYAHDSEEIRINIGPQDFFQVNSDLNKCMVQQALHFLNIDSKDRVLDLFCGLGNFTLPIAKRCKEVVAVEVDKTMVRRAGENAEFNQISNTNYIVADLMGDLSHTPWGNEKFDKVLLDPPRSGAKEVIEEFGCFGARTIVYISCHPGTLARDAGELVHTHGYRLTHAGVMDMFPHTAHVESIAVFEK